MGGAVIAISVGSAYKLVCATLRADWLLWLLFAATAITTAWTEAEIVWLFVLCGVVALLVKAPPQFLTRPTGVSLFSGLIWTTSGLHGAASAATLGTLTLFFLKAGAFVFGSGLAIVPFLYGGLGAEFHWLTEKRSL